jgi:hypothetical protein
MIQEKLELTGDIAAFEGVQIPPVHFKTSIALIPGVLQLFAFFEEFVAVKAADKLEACFN